MKPLSSSLDTAYKNLTTPKKEVSDFPSFEHFVAWKIADAFNEPYGFWVRKVKTTWLLAGQVEHELEVLLSKGAFTRRQKAKMLMATMFPQSTGKTPPRGV